MSFFTHRGSLTQSERHQRPAGGSHESGHRHTGVGLLLLLPVPRYLRGHFNVVFFNFILPRRRPSAATDYRQEVGTTSGSGYNPQNRGENHETERRWV